MKKVILALSLLAFSSGISYAADCKEGEELKDGKCVPVAVEEEKK